MIDNKQHIAILIVNLGTPEAPEKRKVRRFLSEFLNDSRVIDLPWLARKILVNAIIVPFRAAKSTAMYRKIWTKAGSPILFHSQNLIEKLNASPSDGFHYFLAMRYGKPSLKPVMEEIRKQNVSEILIVPLFPQYASSTSGSVIQKALQIISGWTEIPKIQVLNSFYEHPQFLQLWKNRLQNLEPKQFDHILFVFHGLPLRQVFRAHGNKSCEEMGCKSEINERNALCYQAQCYHHTQLLTDQLQIEKEKYSVCFQSRFGKNWLGPFADQQIIQLAQNGKQRVLIVPLSFVADCLETKLEIEIEYTHLFRENGGKELVMAESLNSGDDWVECLRCLAIDE